MIRQIDKYSIGVDFYDQDNGSSTVEFVLCASVVLGLFFSIIELGLHLTRTVALEHSVSKVTRALKVKGSLGTEPILISEIKRDICDQSYILKNCETRVEIETFIVDGTTIIPSRISCRTNKAEVTPIQSSASDGDLVLFRICYDVFGATISPLNLIGGEDGDANIVTSTMFVMEPAL